VWLFGVEEKIWRKQGEGRRRNMNEVWTSSTLVA
jgi:hypothetical protein